jgi:hypothetical protein
MYHIEELKEFLQSVAVNKIEYDQSLLDDMPYMCDQCYAMSYSFDDNSIIQDACNTIIVRDSSMEIAKNSLKLLFKYDNDEADVVLDSLDYLSDLFDQENYIKNWGFTLCYMPSNNSISFKISNCFSLVRTYNVNYFQSHIKKEKLNSVYHIKTLGIQFIRHYAANFYGTPDFSIEQFDIFNKYTTKDIINYYGKFNDFNYIGLNKTQLFFRSKGIDTLSCRHIKFDYNNIHILKEYFSLILCKDDCEQLDNLFHYMFLYLKTLNKNPVIYFSLVQNYKAFLNITPIECYKLQYDINVLCLGYDLNFINPYNHVSEQNLNIFYTTCSGVYGKDIESILNVENDLLNIRVASKLGKKSKDLSEDDYDLYSMIMY